MFKIIKFYESAWIVIRGMKIFESSQIRQMMGLFDVLK